MTAATEVDAINHLRDWLINDTLSMSDDEIAAEIREAGEDPAQVAAKTRDAAMQALKQFGSEMKKITTLKFDDGTEMTVQDARELWRELNSLFGQPVIPAGAVCPPRSVSPTISPALPGMDSKVPWTSPYYCLDSSVKGEYE